MRTHSRGFHSLCLCFERETWEQGGRIAGHSGTFWPKNRHWTEASDFGGGGGGQEQPPRGPRLPDLGLEQELRLAATGDGRRKL